MSLRQFEYPLAVAEQGPVTAAESLRVTQPSVSQEIRGLERELGVELFARTPTGLVPTAVGRAFPRDAEAAVSAARRARATARAGAEELVGELVVSAQLGLGTRQLPGALPAAGGHGLRGAELRRAGAAVPPRRAGPRPDGGVRAEPLRRPPPR
ncbi:LysR family transcriptional regulator [Streptomyces sp. G6]|uniref:LysR family transcriptional regulator n=1 Tax=Streptomyces sp. G6 TaxID=1178736 RepID=UPI003EDA65AF